MLGSRVEHMDAVDEDGAVGVGKVQEALPDIAASPAPSTRARPLPGVGRQPSRGERAPAAGLRQPILPPPFPS